MKIIAKSCVDCGGPIPDVEAQKGAYLCLNCVVMEAKLKQECNVCREMRPLKEFKVTSARTTVYRRGQCRECLLEYFRQRARRKREAKARKLIAAQT